MYNQNNSYGMFEMIRSTVQLPVMGKVLFVCPSTDPNYERLTRLATPDHTGDATQIRLYSTFEAAYAAATTNQNDVIVLSAHSSHAVSAMVTMSKNRVHVIGFDGGGRMSGQGAKIQMGVTGVATDLAPILVTGVRNTFRNVKVINASTTNESLYGFIENGEATLIENCSFMKVAGLDDANHAHFWMAGDSLNMKNVTIGQSNIPSSAAGFGILIDGKAGGGAGGVVKENYLENVVINMSVANGVVGTSCFIKVNDASALNFGNIVNGIIGNNFQPVGAAAMTDATLGTGGTSGTLSLVNASWFGCTGVGAVTGINIAAPSVAPDANGGLATALTD